MIDTGRLERLIEQEFQFLQQERARWSLLHGDQNMELVAHALRVLLHVGKVKESLAEYHAVVDIQHADGGWGSESNDSESAAWVTAFIGLMLIRANIISNDAKVRASVDRAIQYFLNTQKSNGRWTDPSWGDLDTTSHPVSFFNVVLGIGEEGWKKQVEGPWKKGLDFILKGQSEDGGWYDREFHPSGVETTAHLGQDAVVASLVLPPPWLNSVEAPCLKAIEWILRHQEPAGSYDEENVDHTMDCTRSLLILSRVLGEQERCRPAIEKALDWIVKVKCERGWPDFPGGEVNLERTCDGLDVMLKAIAWESPDRLEVVRLWGYVPGIPKFQPKQAIKI